MILVCANPIRIFAKAPMVWHPNLRQVALCRAILAERSCSLPADCLPDRIPPHIRASSSSPQAESESRWPLRSTCQESAFAYHRRSPASSEAQCCLEGRLQADPRRGRIPQGTPSQPWSAPLEVLPMRDALRCRFLRSFGRLTANRVPMGKQRIFPVAFWHGNCYNSFQ